MSTAAACGACGQTGGGGGGEWMLRGRQFRRAVLAAACAALCVSVVATARRDALRGRQLLGNLVLAGSPAVMQTKPSVPFMPLEPAPVLPVSITAPAPYEWQYTHSVSEPAGPLVPAPAQVSGSPVGAGEFPLGYFTGMPIWAEKRGAAYVDSPQPATAQPAVAMPGVDPKGAAELFRAAYARAFAATYREFAQPGSKALKERARLRLQNKAARRYTPAPLVSVAGRGLRTAARNAAVLGNEPSPLMRTGTAVVEEALLPPSEGAAEVYSRTPTPEGGLTVSRQPSRSKNAVSGDFGVAEDSTTRLASTFPASVAPQSVPELV